MTTIIIIITTTTTTNTNTIIISISISYNLYFTTLWTIIAFINIDPLIN